MKLTIGIANITYKGADIETVVETIRALNPLTFQSNVMDANPIYMESCIAVRYEELEGMTEVFTKCLKAGTIVQVDAWMHNIEL